MFVFHLYFCVLLLYFIIFSVSTFENATPIKVSHDHGESFVKWVIKTESVL